MKKWMIVSIVFMLFGCAKSDEDKCKDKGWFWHEATKECKETPPEGGTPTSAEAQESCKAKAGHMWDKSNSQCKKVDYFMLVHPEDSEHEVFLSLREGNNISISGEAYPKKGGCVKVPGPYIINLIVQVKTSSWGINPWSDICNSRLAEEEKKCKSGIYELRVNDDDDFILQFVTLDAERTDCNILKLDSGN